jgi:hypothetical protein
MSDAPQALKEVDKVGPRFVLWKDFVCVQHLSSVEVILSQDGLN